jgi:hypothetical protein
MTIPSLRLPRLAWTVVLVRALGVATAALLAIDAYVHFNDAGLYDIGTGASITQGSLFRAEASVAVVIAVALLVWPHWLVWVIAVLVAASAAGAVYLYTYVDVGRLGPLPDMYEPTWALPGKRTSAVAEAVATATAVAGLVTALYARRKSSQQGGDQVRSWSAIGRPGRRSE